MIMLQLLETPNDRSSRYQSLSKYDHTCHLYAGFAQRL